ncbi:hypothetical protein AK830_g11271 [Neonectria ditissima]|uniref:Ketoreductase domain-containing protein n=1 Tax=Neonectria ditissima TaxID=78410 RepID=A0A0P7B1U1_9HYPO|nr:hypothetical protein AK830_g11271 [Neonectria ditissima]
MKIQGTTFLITGGSSGLGRGCARNIVQNGGNAAVLDVNAELGHTLVKELGSSAMYFHCDVSDMKSITAAVEGAVNWSQETGNPVGGIITAAGVGTPSLILDEDRQPCSLEHIDFVLDINLHGTLKSIRQLLPHLSAVPEGPDGERGVVIMVASSAAFEGQSGLVVYAASKGAVVSMTLPMARDLGRHGIRVVTIAPGLFETGMTKPMRPEDRERLTGAMEFPLRAGKPEEFANLVEQFLDFPKMQEWHNDVLTVTRKPSVKPAVEGGDELVITFNGRRMTTYVLMNSEQEFRWVGSAVFGLLKGQHSFRFTPSKETPNSTTFIQAEEFNGPLAFLQGSASPLRKTLQDAFEKFNSDLKAVLERED